MENGNQVRSRSVRCGNDTGEQRDGCHKYPSEQEGEGVVLSDADQHTGEQMAEKKRPHDSEYAASSDEARSLRNDQAHQALAGCPKGKADTHLLRPLRKGVGDRKSVV